MQLQDVPGQDGEFVSGARRIGTMSGVSRGVELEHVEYVVKKRLGAMSEEGFKTAFVAATEKLKLFWNSKRVKGGSRTIRALWKDKCFCPVTAVCFSETGRYYVPQSAQVAANVLRISTALSDSIIFAADGDFYNAHNVKQSKKMRAWLRRHMKPRAKAKRIAKR